MTRHLPGLVLATAVLAACSDSPESRILVEAPPAAAAAAPAPAAERRPGESAAAFAARHVPVPGDGVEHVTEVALPGRASGVAAFYMRPDALLPKDSYPDMAGYLFVPAERGGYARVLIDSIGHEGGPPEIKHVFLANADRDPAPEVLLIVSWMSIRYDSYTTFYSALAYDAPDPRDPPRRLAPVALSDELEFQCECEWRDGRREKARFTTPEAVKAALAEANR